MWTDSDFDGSIGESRSIRAGLRTLGVLLGLAPAIASATTIGVGATVERSVSTNYPANDPLVMDGGTLRFAIPATGGPLAMSAVDAVLGRGLIYHWYSQSGVTSFTFSGTTTVPGAPVGPAPADKMSISASPFDTTGLRVVNDGTFVQSGTGELNLLGRVTFVGALFSAYFFDNDRGIQAQFIPGVTDNWLVNDGGSFIKRIGGGTSTIDVPIVHNGGKYETWTGSIALNAGGTYQSPVFYGEAFIPNPTGGIVFSGGTHVFRGFSTTEFGHFRIDPGATVRASTTTPINGGQGEWRQRGDLRVEGALEIDGSVLTNTGSIETIGTGAIAGGPAGGYSPVFANQGIFSGAIHALPVPPSSVTVVGVTNDGHFTVPAGRSVEVGDFVNQGSGVLVVDGTLTNLNGGLLQIASGELRGNGLINGDAFVGGGPTTAVFRPGSSPGTMTIAGQYVQDTNGELELEIGGVAPGTFDVVDASGGLVVNEGTIRFERYNGYPGQVGAQYDFFAGQAISVGANVQIVDNTGLDLVFDVDTGLVTVPEPGQALLLGTGLIGLMGLASTRGTRRLERSHCERR